MGGLIYSIEKAPSISSTYYTISIKLQSSLWTFFVTFNNYRHTGILNLHNNVNTHPTPQTAEPITQNQPK